MCGENETCNKRQRAYRQISEPAVSKNPVRKWVVVMAWCAELSAPGCNILSWCSLRLSFTLCSGCGLVKSSIGGSRCQRIRWPPANGYRSASITYPNVPNPQSGAEMSALSAEAHDNCSCGMFADEEAINVTAPGRNACKYMISSISFGTLRAKKQGSFRSKMDRRPTEHIFRGEAGRETVHGVVGYQRG